MAVSYAALYFPYPPGSVPSRVLSWYVTMVARGAGAVLHVFDRNVSVDGVIIHGRYPLKIVLDCTAVDVQALYVAAVSSFPVPWRQRVAGALTGLALVSVANLLRVASLYFVGVYWPTAFHCLHEEVLQFAMVAVACLAFAIWVGWTRQGRWGKAHVAA